jgi:hypothetical protein
MHVGAATLKTGELAARGQMMIFRFKETQE